MWQVKKRPISKVRISLLPLLNILKTRVFNVDWLPCLAMNMKCLLSWGKCMEMFPDVYDRFEENHPEMCK